MHEHSFIQAIISNIQDKEKVKSIDLQVGELAGIELIHLKEHLEQETGWIVNVSSTKAIIKCTCGYIGDPQIRQRLHDLVIYNCPKCNAIPKPIQGKDIKITKIIYKD